MVRRPRILTPIANSGLLLLALVLMAWIEAPGRAFALSELQQSAPSPDAAVSAPSPDAAVSAPISDSADAPAEPDALPPLEGPEIGPDGGLPDPAPAIRRSDEPGGVIVSEPAPAPEVIRDVSALPAPAARMRELIIQAARTGEPERLRALLGAGPTATQLSLSGIEEDPIEYLESISGDGKGIELLAIMLDILDAGFVHVDEGGANDLYVWPYFVATDLDALTPEQTVELLRIVTAGDLEDMRNFGAYNFFRIGISPDGEWRFFISGD